MPSMQRLCTCLLLMPALAFAQTAPADPHNRLIAATGQSSLLSPDLRPWYLKADVTLFDFKGKNPVAGTIETWHSGNDSRTVETFGDSSFTLLNSGDSTYVGQKGKVETGLAKALLDAILNPGPSPQDLDHVTLDLRKEKFGKVPLDCIMLSRPIHSIPTETIPLGLFPTYCLSPDSTKLRVSFDLGSQAVFRNSLGTFQGKDVSTNVILRLADVIVAEAKVEKLMTFVPTEITFAPTPDLTAVFGRAARVSGGVIAGNILTKTQPVYPEIAKANHISGTVVLRAIIGRDGHVYSLHVMSGGDVSLAIAAIAAVREWTYKPYLLNGEPVEVDTTITVNFNLN